MQKKANKKMSKKVNKPSKSREQILKKQMTLFFIACLCLAGVALYCFACSRLDDANVWGEVSVNGVPVGGLSREQATLAVHSRFGSDYRDMALKVDLAGKEYEVDIFPALGFKATDTISKAYAPGHRLWIARGFDWLLTKFKGSRSYTIYPYVKDMEAMDAAVEKSGILKYNDTVKPKWEIKDNSLVIRKGKEGAAIDEEQLKQKLLTAINEHNYEEVIVCPAAVTPPKEADIQKIYKKVRADVSNATLNPEKDYEIVPSVTGINFDITAAQAIYDSTGYGETAVIPIEVTEPEITTEDMEEKLFRDVLSSYSTYGGGSEARMSNISLAVEACNDVILLPGESFSYNAALGERTIERGYQTAAAYSSNEVIQEVGGGICQVSSTIFAALLYTDLEIDERLNHSLPVSYLPLGMDATVSWGSPDFRFTNTYKYPVKLNAYFDGETVTAEFTGTKENEDIIDVALENLSEYTVNTYRVHYDSSWNVLSKEQVAYSDYTNPNPTPIPEVTEIPEDGSLNNSENTENTDNTENTENGSGDWENSGTDGSDTWGDDGGSDNWDTENGSDGSDDWNNGEPSEDDMVYYE